MSTDYCPHCDAPLKPNAVACRQCGSDLETGWSSDIDYHSIELPEEPLESGRSGNFRTIAIICIILMLAGSGVFLLAGMKNIALVIVIIALALPIALGHLPGDEDSSSR